MRDSFWVGASGLNQYSKGLDVVSNNVSNVGTTGFKASRATFEDVFSQTIKLGGDTAVGGNTTINPQQRGLGVILGAITKSFKQGAPETTGSKTDLTIVGNGFFVTAAPTGAASDLFHTRNGHFLVDSNGAVGSPIKLVSPEGYYLQGVNATIDAATGEYVLPAAEPPTPVDISFDPNLLIGPLATTSATFGQNLNNQSPIALEPRIINITNQGVDRSFRVEFQRASATPGYYFFTVQNPTPDPITLQFATLTDGLAAGAPPITGVVQLDNQGLVANVYQNTDADAFLTAAEVAALVPWANVDGGGNPIFTIGTAPAAVVPAAPGENTVAIARPAIPVGWPAAAPDANSETITLNNRTLTRGTDYTIVGAVITPLTAWDSGTARISYTTGGGTTRIEDEPASIVNANATRSFQTANFPIQTALALPNPPFSTLVVNATRGGVAVRETIDYTVDNETGRVVPLTLWDAPAVAANVTVGYTPADTRVTVQHNLTGRSIVFANALIENGNIEFTPRPLDETSMGTGLTAYDSLGNAHSVSFSFERLSSSRWLWTATPYYRLTQTETSITDSAAGGGTVGEDGLFVAANVLKQLPTGLYDLKLTIDTGSGPEEWSQVAHNPLDPTAFPSTSATSKFFKVVDPATGEIALSRDALNSPFFLRAAPGGARAYDAGTLSLTLNGAALTSGVDYNENAATGQITPLRMWTSGTIVAGYRRGGVAVTGEQYGATYSVKTEYPSNVATGEGTVAFTAAGDYDAANSLTYTPVQFTPQGAAQVAITPDFTALKNYTRQSDAVITASNGFPSGKLQDWEFDDEGKIVAQYSNGKQQYLARVVLAAFPNPEGLLANGESVYIESASSGVVRYFYAGTSPVTGLQSGTYFQARTLEASNVDMSEELTNLILLQRAYQFNSRIVTTSDEMIKEAIQMKR